jgi:hypothetical protein
MNLKIMTNINVHVQFLILILNFSSVLEKGPIIKLVFFDVGTRRTLQPNNLRIIKKFLNTYMNSSTVSESLSVCASKLFTFVV